MEDSAEQVVTFAWSKFLLIITSLSISVSLLEITEYIKIYSYFVAAGSGTLAFILYIFKVKDKIKSNLRKEIEKNCPPEGINTEEKA